MRVLPRSIDGRAEEAVGLAYAIADLEVLGSSIVKISQPRPATLFGTGKLQELKALFAEQDVEVVIIDHALTPIQQRNLERDWKVKVLDRTGLILEIFGDRARTKEGRLQVELAHLTYQKSRLVRSWTHLERQRGGVGFLGGPGETQIEADRRMIQEKINRLERQLESVRKTRRLHRKGRKKIPHPVITLVGYTNAGKSTLFNRLTDAGVFAQDLLFATLDPTLRQLALPNGTPAILSDTVGFISDLPTHLVAAFRATLEEVMEAEIILHVRDIAHEDSNPQAEDVCSILRQLDLDPEDGRRVIEVWNKIDNLDADHRAKLLCEQQTGHGEGVQAMPVSAQTGEGLDALLALIEEKLSHTNQVLTVTLSHPVDGKAYSWLHANTEVLAREDFDNGDFALTVRVPERHVKDLKERFTFQ